MSLPNIFTKEVSEQVVARIEKLTPNSPHLRGKMNVAQMLAHCCISFEYCFEPEKHTRPNRLMRQIITLFAKKMVTSETPFPKNSRTAPEMIMNTEHNFAIEQVRLINFIQKVQIQGEDYYDGLESRSFGKLNKEEWSNLFYKHLDHHLQQFGV
jgi:Protein of unknown function (DUF1569)